MGAKFESEAVITGSIQNKKQFIVQQTQAHVAFLSEKAENCFVDASLSALFQLSVGDRVVLEATKANQKYNFSFTTLKIIEKIYCSKTGEAIKRKQSNFTPAIDIVVPKEINWSEQIIKELMGCRCLEFSDLWKKVTGFTERKADFTEEQTKTYHAIERALHSLEEESKLFRIEVYRNTKGRQEKASHTYYGRKSDPTILAEVLETIDPNNRKKD
jgi:hypothetical protein